MFTTAWQNILYSTEKYLSVSTGHLVSLAGGAVQHAESVLVLVEEAGAAPEQDLHHARVPLLHRAPQRGRAVLALGVNILAHLRGKILYLSSKNIFYCCCGPPRPAARTRPAGRRWRRGAVRCSRARPAAEDNIYTRASKEGPDECSVSLGTSLVGAFFVIVKSSRTTKRKM